MTREDFHKAAADLKPDTRMLIDGKLVEARSGKKFETINPANDQVIAAQFLFASAAALGRGGAAVQWHISPQTGHSIDEHGLALGGTFLSMAFRGLLSRQGPEISCSVG